MFKNKIKAINKTPKPPNAFERSSHTAFSIHRSIYNFAKKTASCVPFSVIPLGSNSHLELFKPRHPPAVPVLGFPHGVSVQVVGHVGGTCQYAGGWCEKGRMKHTQKDLRALRI